MEINFEKDYLRELYEDGKTLTFWNCQTIINKRK